MCIIFGFISFWLIILFVVINDLPNLFWDVGFGRLVIINKGRLMVCVVYKFSFFIGDIFW